MSIVDNKIRNNLEIQMHLLKIVTSGKTGFHLYLFRKNIPFSAINPARLDDRAGTKVSNEHCEHQDKRLFV